MAIQTIVYSSKIILPFTLVSTASSATWVAGAESDQVDNSVDDYVDILVQGRVTVGATITANTSILIYIWGSDTSAATTNLDTIDGVTSAETLTSAGIRNGLMTLIGALDVDATTANRTYWMRPTAIAQHFGGVIPRFWGLFLAHNTGSALNATAANHEFSYMGIKYDIT